MDLTTSVIWMYSFGTGMFVGILGIATGSMGISYSGIKDTGLFKAAYRKVMIMVKFYFKIKALYFLIKAWVTISFSFCIFFWIVVALGMFVENYWRYPYAYIGEFLCFMIQWGFLFYLINIYGSPCAVLFFFSPFN